jgi:hypothetical protein
MGNARASVEAMPGLNPWALVQPDQVHRDIYLSEDIFALEM